MSSLFNKVAFVLLLPCAVHCFAAVHAIVPSCLYNGTGANWTCAVSSGAAGAYNAVPGTLTRGDIYYFADGSYGTYIFSQAVSGTSTVEFRKAQSYDYGSMTGWNTSTMGSAQAIFARAAAGDPAPIEVSASYFTLNGNGTQTAQGCGGAPGSNVEASPPTVTDCGFKLDNYSCNSATADACDTIIYLDNSVTNVTVEYAEIRGNGQNASETAEIVQYGTTTGPSAYTHVYGHNSGCVYFIYGGDSRTTSFSYFWGTEVRGVGSSPCHGQYSFVAPPSSNGIEHDNVYRDITGTSVFTFANPGTGTSTGWEYYNNVIWNSSPAAIDPTTNLSWAPYLSNGTIACINTGVLCGSSGSPSVFVQNSIVNAHYQTGIEGENGGYFTVQNNVWYANTNDNGVLTCPSFYGSGETFTENHNSCLASGSSAPFTGTNDVTDASAPNPFVSWTTGNFNIVSENSDWTGRLSLSSPYTADPNGTQRSTDRGAYQFGGTQPPTNVQVTTQ